MIKKIIKDKMQVSSVPFFPCPFKPFSILSNIFILIQLPPCVVYHLCNCIFLSFILQKIASAICLSHTHYSLLSLTIYEENMLTHQTSLKELLCEKMFPITLSYIKIAGRCCMLSALAVLAIIK